MNIGIIGTAGRNDDFDKLSTQVFKNMIFSTINIVGNVYEKNIFKEQCTLISGGAAFADHIAVMIFLSGQPNYNLSLHLPAEFDSFNETFVEKDNLFDSGKTANYYHKKFSKKCNLNSLKHIATAIKNGAKFTVGSDFKSRNTQVANYSDVLIALTYGDGAKLKDGGTLDTMTKFLKKKDKSNSYHINISDMKVYNPAIV